MDWKSIGQKVGSMAPYLGTLLGGPAGGAVGTLVAQALGTEDNAAAVYSALNSDPVAAVKLMELQENAKIQLQQLAVQAELNRMSAEAAQYVAEVSDRDSARKLAAAQPNDIIRPVIILILLIGGLAILACVFFGFATEVLRDPVAASAIGIIVGFWFNEIKAATGFYFGMTKESAVQNREISRWATAPGTVTVVNDSSPKEIK
jgi:hypothetical protein